MNVRPKATLWAGRPRGQPANDLRDRAALEAGRA